MLFGRSLRPPMKRTPTSMTILGLDLSDDVGVKAQDAPSTPFFVQEGLDQKIPSETIPTRNSRGHSPDFLVMEAAGPGHYFLGTCCLCKRQLIPGRDIFMYRGDSAFCSHECRQQQMKQDERKEKCSLSAASAHQPPSSGAATTRMNVVGPEGETVAAV
ncbi:hypothetical protein MLD38_022440 [Melastoma candidum]|uniref:Uncharacterized protein n=1 Tax=Melastoma candidum TaxID=119954 RepID=A0ACB9QKG2_9MYRT|nr:hypothetical protein MLD38_022440 [Melastoma candidum]